MASKYITASLRYEAGVLSGKIPAGKLVIAACERQKRDRGRKGFAYRFDESAAVRACSFAEKMVHVKGKWAQATKNGDLPFIHLEDWQCFLLCTLFGWVRKSDGLRRFREIYAEIARKNAKSIIGAIIGLYLAFADDEIGAEVFSGATSLEQALAVFRPAWMMVKNNPEFREHFGLELGGTDKNPGNIYQVSTGSRFQPIIGKPGDGDSPHGAIIDEYHEHKDSGQYDAMKTGMGARTQPLRVIITTAGEDTSGPCYDKHLEAIKVLEGALENDELFTVIYGIDVEESEDGPKGDDWTDFRVWRKANPNLGISVFEDYLRSQLRDAMQSPSQQNIIRTKNLNQWMNAGTAWMNMVTWGARKDTSLTLERFKGEECWLGMDLASKIDIASVAYLFRHGDGWAFFAKHYLPEETIELPHNQHYRKWRDAGWLIQTDGARTDLRRIEADILDASRMFSVQSLAFDQKEANYLVSSLQDQVSFPCIDVPQGPAHMSEPMKEMEAAVYAGTLHHCGDPVLTWMMGNVIKKKGGGGGPVKFYYPTKSREANKIDGVVAGIMALSRAMVAEPSPSYEVTVI